MLIIIVTLLSTDMGVEPMSSVYHYCSDTKRKEHVSCLAVIKSNDANMGGIDKSDAVYYPLLYEIQEVVHVYVCKYQVISRSPLEELSTSRQL